MNIMKYTEIIMKRLMKRSHFPSHLRGGKVKFLQADYVSIPELVHLAAFGVKQDFKGQDELQVGGRSHVISLRSWE